MITTPPIIPPITGQLNPLLTTATVDVDAGVEVEDGVDVGLAASDRMGDQVALHHVAGNPRATIQLWQRWPCPGNSAQPS